jgi:flagellar hook assembly protein FlgD
MVPAETKLHQNYPNPFNPTTTIKFDLNSDSVVKLNVYNYNGQLVRSLVDGSMNAGLHTVEFDASDLCAGVYYYTMEAGNSLMANKMVLVK